MEENAYGKSWRFQECLCLCLGNGSKAITGDGDSGLLARFLAWTRDVLSFASVLQQLLEETGVLSVFWTNRLPLSVLIAELSK